MIGNHYRRAGSFESTAQTDSEVDVAAAYMDLDTGGTFVRFGAKGPGSLGVKIRTLNSGAAVNAVIWSANGDGTLAGNITMSSGKTLAAQAITATSVTGTAALSGFTTANFSSTITQTGNGAQLINTQNGVVEKYIHWANTTGDAYVGLTGTNGAALFTGGSINALQIGTASATALEFGTSDIIRVTIPSGGGLSVLSGTTAVQTLTSTGATFNGDTVVNAQLRASNNSSGGYVSTFTNPNANPLGVAMSYSGAAPNDTSHNFINCDDTGGNRFQARSNGGLANFSANNVNLSDARLKTDVRDLESQWSKHLQLRVVRGKFKDQTHGDDNYMGIAQNVGAVYPELMDDHNPDRLGIYETDLNWITRGVVQECQRRIESLERRLAA